MKSKDVGATEKKPPSKAKAKTTPKQKKAKTEPKAKAKGKENDPPQNEPKAKAKGNEGDPPQNPTKRGITAYGQAKKDFAAECFPIIH